MESFIQNIKKMGNYKKQIVHVEEIPAKSACLGKLSKPLPVKLQKYLENKNIKLYSHQVEAINNVREGKNVVIVTPTASGKTLAFNVPVFESLFLDKNATALYLYPTKALTNDQLKVLKELEKATGIKANSNVYDGDTPQHQRAIIRLKSRVILSNPYGLHQYLSWHNKWQSFFKNLKFLVIDEAHVYRGVFGSNVAMLFRRLLRICNYYNTDPCIVVSSATISNPKEHANNLIGKNFEVVNVDGAPRGRKFFVFWNPPFIDEEKTFRRSTHQETKDHLILNLTSNLQTLCFTTSRQLAELITRWTREELAEKLPNKVSKVAAYRAGYLADERRQIEDKLKNKDLIGIVSTNALEVGVDIGSLDAVIISGYPGTIISTWQQAGRAGRKNIDSLVTLIAFQNPLDQYFMKNPKDFFGRPHERAIINLENPYILLGHMMCGASELPLTPKDKIYFPKLFEETIKVLEEMHLVSQTSRGLVYSGLTRPVESVNLNSIANRTVTVFCGGKVLETLALTKAYKEVHKGAVLLHQGETYICTDLNLESLTAEVIQKDVNYYTEAKKTADVQVKTIFEEKSKSIIVGLGQLEITEKFSEFLVKTYDKVIGREPIDLPALNFSTVGLWFTVRGEVRSEVENHGLNFEGGLHAVEHAMIALSPMFAMCDRWDIGGFSTVYHPDTGFASIFIYDGFEGGIGISEVIFENLVDLWKKTLHLIESCECTEGCPSCIYSPKCGNENEPLDKNAACIILKELLKVE